MDFARETEEKDAETMSTDTDTLDGNSEDDDSQGDVVRVHFHGEQLAISGPKDMTIAQLSSSLAELLSIAPEKQKILITPKPGMLKFPFPDVPLASLTNNNNKNKNKNNGRSESKITLLGSTEKEISDLNATITKVRAAAGRSAPKAGRARDWKKIQEESMYTFQSIRALAYLPNPERSRRFLERLANDPGIKAAMRAHRFSVGLLTEMDPAEHTTQESRTLGLNRNRGEVVELRLRTDRYDGYRDYRVIRKTLCHELAHNVYGEHDRNFWDLTAQIENEVDRADWKHGGHRLTHHEFYNPADQADDHPDAGGWTGGDFVLGSLHGSHHHQGLSRREILARAAMGRAEKQKGAAAGGAEVAKRTDQGREGGDEGDAG